MLQTLAQLQANSIRKPLPIALPSKVLASKLLTVNLSDASTSPDREAVEFYALNQAVAVIQGMFTQNEKLPEWASAVVSLYDSTLRSQYRRMLHYTFLVISREWRHLKNLKTVGAMSVEAKKWYPALLDLHPHIADSTSTNSLTQWLKLVPELHLDKYSWILMHSFDNGNWGGGYGGKPWGEIARTFHRHVIGETSGEVFVDTAYTLAHNNGPMFNKGMLYSMYSSDFIKVLDIQRSGQVAEAALSGVVASYCGGPVLKALTDMQAEVSCFGKYVDWFKVESLGAVKTYTKEKAQQIKVHGDPTVNKPVLVEGQAVKVKGTFEWFPGKTVQIVERMV